MTIYSLSIIQISAYVVYNLSLVQIAPCAADVAIIN